MPKSNNAPVHENTSHCPCGDDHTPLTEAEIAELKKTGKYTGK